MRSSISPDLLEHTAARIALVPADCELDGLGEKVPADGDDNLGFCICSVCRRGFFRALPEYRGGARDGQRWVFDDQLVIFVAELPVDLPLAVAGNVVTDLKHLGQVIAGPLVGIILGIVNVRRGGGQHQRLQKRIRLHDAGAVRVRLRFHADEAEAVIQTGRFHGQANASAPRALQRNLHCPPALRPDAAAHVYDLRLSIQLVLQPYTAGNLANRQPCWILHSQLCHAALTLA